MPEYLVLKHGKQSFANVVRTLTQELKYMDEEVDMLCDGRFLTFQKKHDAQLHRITSQLMELKQNAPEPPADLAALEVTLKPKLKAKIRSALLEK